MATVKDSTIRELDHHANDRLKHETDREKIKQTHAAQRKALDDRHEAELAVIETKISYTNQQISNIITEHRSELFLPGKKSFTTFVASFALRTVPARHAVLDAKTIMEVARKLGVVRKIATPVREYKFNAIKFYDWLAQNGELRSHFEQCIDEVPERESLSMRLNSKNETIYDGQRLTNKSITITPS